jgi:hypothetical protein
METLRGKKRKLSSVFSKSPRTITDQQRPDTIDHSPTEAALKHTSLISRESTSPVVISLLDDVPTIIVDSSTTTRPVSSPILLDLTLPDNDDLNDPAAIALCENNSTSMLRKDIHSCMEADSDIKCLFCDEDLSQWSDTAKEEHLHHCLDKHGFEGTSYSQHMTAQTQQSSTSSLVYWSINAISNSVEEQPRPNNERGLRLPEFFCVLCDANISKRSLLARCKHLKHCARERHMTTKQLLQFISPADEADEDIDDDDNTAALACQTVSEHNVHNAEARNAWDVLMSSAKEQSRMKGLFDRNVGRESATMPSVVSVRNANANVSLKTSSWGPQQSKPRSTRTTTTKRPSGNAGYAPAFKKIQLGSMSCPIVVDGFQYSSSLLSDCYFLTHFHSDHYVGLTSDFDAGTVCREISF